MIIKGQRGFFWLEDQAEVEIKGLVFKSFFDAKKWLDNQYDRRREWKGSKKK